MSSQASKKISRNAPCPCASGKKYKKCCLPKEAEQRLRMSRLSELVEEGYAHLSLRQTVKACERWYEVWKAIIPMFRPEMRTFDSADEVFTDLHFFSNWIDDFALELHNAAVLIEPQYAEIGCEVCDFLLAQFASEKAARLLYVRADLGMFHALAGRFEDAEQILLELMRKHPEEARGFVWLADILQGIRRGEPPRDLPRARALLARARQCKDAEDFDVEERIKAVDRLLAASTTAAEDGSTHERDAAQP